MVVEVLPVRLGRRPRRGGAHVPPVDHAHRRRRRRRGEHVRRAAAAAVEILLSLGSGAELGRRSQVLYSWASP